MTMHATTSAISANTKMAEVNCWVNARRVGLRRGELAAGLHLIARHSGQRRDRGGQPALRRARRGARRSGRSPIAGDGEPAAV
jgi:hypothetical protein